MCVTATKGELGFPDDDPRSLEERGELRAAELKACLATFGDIEHRFMGYRDGGCGDVPPDQPVAQLVAILREMRPAHVFTFGPDGGTDHVDHKAVCAWTTAAVAAAGVDTELHYATQTPDWLAENMKAFDSIDVFMTPGFVPTTTPRDELSVYVVLDDEEMAVKKQAMLCQASQVQPLVDALGEAFFEFALREEFFVRAE